MKTKTNHGIPFKWFIINGLLFLGMVFPAHSLHAQKNNQNSKITVSRVWVPDLGNGYYKNPILFADYSDPDVCRVGDNYYMVSSSFCSVPGLPVLHSKDLVNWTIMGHALQKLIPYKHYSKPQHGKGVWAPAIRYHDGEFYVYYPDPDYGIYMVKAKNPAGPWSPPILVMAGKGLEDPCPLWDNDGKAYLIHAFAGSRAGIKSILVINRMNWQGTKVLDTGVIVYDGHKRDRDVEGPKLYKRNGYYYIFAPAGGVQHGWQIVLRSKHIYGPYQRKKVMDQGNTPINGPHQGAWVTTPEGASWFVHFQGRGAYGRVTLLEPVKWVNNWPVIGKNQGNGVGEPVLKYKMPYVGKKYPVATPQTSDKFNGDNLGLQWQWQANPRQNWVFPDPGQGSLRLYCELLPPGFKNYWDVPNILTQKFPAPAFTATAKLTFFPHDMGDKVGFIVLGKSYAYLSLVQKPDGIYVDYSACENAYRGNQETVHTFGKISTTTIYFRVKVTKDGSCHFSYSTDGRQYHSVAKSFQATGGVWVGAKVGMFCTCKIRSHDSGYADFDWFRITKN